MIESFTPDQICSVRFEKNEKEKPPVCSNHADGQRTRKVILPKPGTRVPEAGQIWRCRFDKDTKPDSSKYGAFIFEPLTEEFDPSSVDAGFPDVWMPPEDAKKVIIAMHDGINVCFQGPQGCGKTHFGHAIAKKFNWRAVQIDCGQIATSKTLFGYLEPRPHLPGEAAAGWKHSDLAELLMTADKYPDDEFVGILDEIGRMDSTGHSAMLPIIMPGPNGTVSVPSSAKKKIADSADKVRLHGNIHWISTQNVGPGFNPQGDAASNDRWLPVNVGYMPADIEVERCLRKYPGAPRQDLERAVKIINDLRQRFLSPKTFKAGQSLTKPVSTRSVLDLTALLRGGITLESAFVTAVASHYKGTVDFTDSEAWKVQEIIKSQL